jgi:hypothetical protein
MPRGTVLVPCIVVADFLAHWEARRIVVRAMRIVHFLGFAPAMHRQRTMLDVDPISSLVDDRFANLHASTRQHLKAMDSCWSASTVHRRLPFPSA